ncbi:MAG: Pentapeptide repeat family protein [Mucilaginibacter sp.]|nr:Pentapeptide repeat family protein [Mucilaginibacter sp.]
MAYAIIAAILLISTLFLWLIPIWQLKNKNNLSRNQVLTLENEFRKTIAQIIGGLFVFVGLYFTWSQLSETRESISISQQVFLTDRYSKAIDQLGSSNPQIRLGGIFSLEKLASSSKEYISVVNNVLATYIRQKSNDTSTYTFEEIQAAVGIISFRETNRDYLIDNDHGVNISNSILKNLYFENARLPYAKMVKSVFTESTFINANLSYVSGMEADFSKTNLSNSILSQSNFYGGSFKQSIMKGSIIKNSNLQLVNFSEANLINCDLNGSDLSDANLYGAILYGADLSTVKGITKDQIKVARINNSTKLPAYIR